MSVCSLNIQNNCSIIFENNNLKSQKSLCNECLNENINISNKWTKNGPCYELLNSISKDNINYIYLKLFMQDIFKQFYDSNCRITSNIDSNSYSSFQIQLYNSCKNFDNVCQYGLNGNPWIIDSFNYCKNKNNIPNNNIFTNNPQLAYFCGCNLNLENYIPTIPIECDSLCGLQNTIKLFDIDNNIIKCKTNICSISDVSLNITKSQTGDINFNQICGGVCGDISCSSCYLNNIGLNVLNSEIKDINFFQKCGGINESSGYLCWKSENGKYVSYNCDEIKNNQIERSFLFYYIYVVSIFVIIFIFIIYLIIKNKSYKI